jgi:hypothetical protein
MSIATMSGPSLSAVHQRFLAELPRIEDVLRFRLRRWPSNGRDEAIADARAAAWHAWSGLVRRGVDPLEVGPTGIAANAVRYVLRGRRLGCGPRGRGAMDIHQARAQAKGRFRVVSLEAQNDPSSGTSGDTWRECAIADGRWSPADEACFRLDFASWLGGLSAKQRRSAELLAAGYTTGGVAELLGVTPGAVSQTRTRLMASWRAFQGEGEADRRRVVANGRPGTLGSLSPAREFGSGAEEEHRCRVADATGAAAATRPGGASPDRGSASSTA